MLQTSTTDFLKQLHCFLVGFYCGVQYFLSWQQEEMTIARGRRWVTWERKQFHAFDKDILKLVGRTKPWVLSWAAPERGRPFPSPVCFFLVLILVLPHLSLSLFLNSYVYINSLFALSFFISFFKNGTSFIFLFFSFRSWWTWLILNIAPVFLVTFLVLLATLVMEATRTAAPAFLESSDSTNSGF